MNSHHSIVIGGTKGLGRGLVQLWSEGEGTICVIGRRLPSADTCVPGERIHYFSADITQTESIFASLDDLVKKFGPVARLVFSQRYRGTGDTLDGELKVGVKATQQIIEHLTETDQFARTSAIVVVSSVCGQFIAAEQPLGYHVTKAALDQLVRFYAVQLAPKGIRVNGVAPNLILKEEGLEFYRQNPDLQRHYEAVIPLGTMGSPRDVANAIDFLCSERARYITGQTLIVDGGLTVLLQHSLGVRPSFRTI